MFRSRWTYVVLVFLLLLAGVGLYRYLDHRAEESREERLRASVEALFREIEADPLARPPVFGEPVPGVAADHYREAVRLYEEALRAEEDLTGEERTIFSGDLEDLKTGPRGLLPLLPAAVRALRAEIYEAIERGARTESAGRIVTFANALAPATTLPHPVGDRHVLRSAIWASGRIEARTRATEGEAAAAVSLLLCLDRLQEDLARDGGWLERIQELDRRRELVTSAAEWMSAGYLPEAELDRLAAWLRAAQASRPDWFRILRTALAWDEFEVLTTDWESPRPDSVLESLESLFSGEVSRGDILDALERMQERRALALAEFEEGGEDAWTRAIRVLTAGPPDPTIDIQFVHSFYSREFRTRVELLGGCRTALRAGIEFHRYRLREGRVPTLDEILPEGVVLKPLGALLDIVPDPVSGEAHLVFSWPNRDDGVEFRMR